MDRKSLLKIGMIYLVITLLINISLTLYINKNYQKEIVSFDMKKTIDTFMAQTIDKNLNDNVIEDLIKNFNEALTESINNYKEKNDVIILVTPAVVSGTEDVTLKIQNEIAQRMVDKKNSL